MAAVSLSEGSDAFLRCPGRPCLGLPTWLRFRTPARDIMKWDENNSLNVHDLYAEPSTQPAAALLLHSRQWHCSKCAAAGCKHAKNAYSKLHLTPGH